MEKIIEFCKRETVLIVSAILACISMLAVPFDSSYSDYIDVRVLVLLFCLMAVIGSTQEQGIFGRLCHALLLYAGNSRAAALVLILLPFFCSMLVTNDVALIAFVPMAIGTLKDFSPKLVIFVVVMQTIAANLGSSLTPIGNPQNLYLSSFYNVNPADFCIVLAPIVLLGFFLIIGSILLNVRAEGIAPVDSTPNFENLHKFRLTLSAVLFLLSVLAVVNILDYRLVFVAVVVSLLFFDPKAFRHVDISLLLTFVCFFVFVGNMARIDFVYNFIAGWIEGRTLLVATMVSQIISNVPAALMLSEFTADGAGLLLGTNIGGLGTPIASMASLISLRYYSMSDENNIKEYLFQFTIYNFLFLVLILSAEWILQGSFVWFM